MANASVARLRVERIGYLVPARFVGTVHSVHARACNIASAGLLCTLVASEIADGPTTLVLLGDRVPDLRTCFEADGRVVCRGGRLVARGVDVDLANAVRWEPDPLSIVGEPMHIAANLRVAGARLSARLEHEASVLHREGREACARIERACSKCDVAAALRDARALIGWGEGLTPAGDDFLVGMLAGLDAQVRSTIHKDFLGRFGDEVASHARRTTDVAAHYLRLAARGHFGADMHRLRNALLTSNDVARVAQLADDSLAAGATSGADQVTGLLAGVSAWLPRTV